MSKNRRRDLERIARMCDALSNFHRLKIFNRLVDCRESGTRWDVNDPVPCCVGEITKDLGIVPSTASHHIKELSNAGLITLERNGQRVICLVNPAALHEIVDFFSSKLAK